MPRKVRFAMKPKATRRAASRVRVKTGRAARTWTARSTAVASAMNPRTGGFMGLESKFLDLVGAHALVASATAAGGEVDPTTVNCISAPATGDDESSRDGNRIMLTSASVTGRINFAGLASQASSTVANSTNFCQYVTVALVHDKQSNGAQLNSEDVFSGDAANGFSSIPLRRNLEYTTRFQVLASTIVERGGVGVVAEADNDCTITAIAKPFELYWNGAIPVQFKGSTAGIGSVQDNSLHVIAFADNTGGTPYIWYKSRVRFQG